MSDPSLNSGVNGVNGGSSHTQEGVEEIDVLVIGAGFAGCYLLHNFRREGFKTKVVETGSGLGGVWYWNRYPGARVDSPYPVYALDIPEVWKDWYWTQEYPDHNELRQYFAHVDKTLDLNKDVIFNTRVEAAAFHVESRKWIVRLSNGTTITTRFLFAGIGFAAKRYIPDWPGLDTFKGEIHHSSYWPKEGVPVQGKKVAVVGTGATGVQIIQETAKMIGADGHLTVFQRTPNLALPMRQKLVSKERQQQDREDLPRAFNQRVENPGGFIFEPSGRNFADENEQEQQARIQRAYDEGGFRPLIASYDDILLNHDANHAVYQHWAKMTRQRLDDPELKDILAPLVAPHPFGGRRPSLEQDYYEQFNRHNVKVVDTKKTPITKLVPEGIVTEDGTVHECDVLAMATGFDAVTGGIKSIRVQGENGQLLTDKWSNGILTYLGMGIHSFPNFFMLYGPQAPTAFANGPTCVELQSKWVLKTCKYMRDNSLTRIEAKESSEQDWKVQVYKTHDATMRKGIDGWYNGGNIPGKIKEPMNYSGSLQMYRDYLVHESEGGYPGFVLS